MGMFDNLRNYFKGSNKSNVAPLTNREDEYRKQVLAIQVLNLVDKIKRINSYDSSIWNLANISNSMLERKSLDELEKICTKLNNRLSELTRQNQTTSQRNENLQEAMWTGEKPNYLTNYEFDRAQRGDER